MRFWVGLPLLLMAAQVSAASAVAPVLQPQGPWKLDYADEECRLVRTFGTGPETLTVQMSRGAGLQEFGMVVAGTTIPKLPEMTKVTLRLFEQDQERQFYARSMQLPDRPERLVRLYGGGSNIIAEFSDNQVLGLKFADHYSVSVKLAGAHRAIAALDACHADLLTSWGLDVNSLKAAKVPPRPVGDPATWATDLDYSLRLRRTAKSGTVTFLLDVDRDGRPTRCSIARSSGVPLLDETTCQLMLRRARFAAAENSEGQPIAGFYVSRVALTVPK